MARIERDDIREISKRNKTDKLAKKNLMDEIDCKTCFDLLPDLLFEPELVGPEARAHLLACVGCRQEFDGLEATMRVLDTWTAPEPSQYFDARVRAQLRQAQAEGAGGLWERLAETFRFGTELGRRSALAGILLFLLLLGGGTAATLWSAHHEAPATSSPAVNDLRIFDNNAQALQQMDLLEEPGSDANAPQPQS